MVHHLVLLGRSRASSLDLIARGVHHLDLLGRSRASSLDLIARGVHHLVLLGRSRASSLDLIARGVHHLVLLGRSRASSLDLIARGVHHLVLLGRSRASSLDLIARGVHHLVLLGRSRASSLDLIARGVHHLDLLGRSRAIISRSHSPWCSPLGPVRKANGDIRLCVDFRRVNELTVKDPYYMSVLEELLMKVGGSKCLSKLDLTKGFHQLAIKLEDRPKTAFVSPFGKFQYNRVPFGLSNAPAMFQRAVELVLVDCVNLTGIYIDDILITLDCWEARLGHISDVLGKLSEAGFKCNKCKCEFGREKLIYLGHRIGGDVLSVPEDRVSVLHNYVRPKSKQQLRSFLGLCNYYCRFVRDFHRYSSLLSPLLGWWSALPESTPFVSCVVVLPQVFVCVYPQRK